MRRFFAVALLAPLILLTLGFDLDKGELKCEQAAARLQECCPALVLPYASCIQQGGCDRQEDGTIISSEESECIKAATCEQIATTQLCERLHERIVAYQDTDRPSLGELYAEDNLCE